MILAYENHVMIYYILYVYIHFYRMQSIHVVFLRFIQM